MSRLSDLIAQAKSKDTQLGADLEREFKALSTRLPFGLNFERHSPEAVQLPLRPIRKGDKVRVLPPRGLVKKGDQRLWQVKTIHKAQKTAELELMGAETAETQTISLNDLVVVAEVNNKLRALDMKDESIQKAVEQPGTAKGLYEASTADDYIN